ncbi:MAG: type II secretion system protein GspE, partial [Candidatus Binataceae bacterium]
PYDPNKIELARIGLDPAAFNSQIFKPGSKGCRACRGTGYRGRTAIQELMLIDDDIRALVMQKADASMIRRSCTAKGMKLLRQEGVNRILAGETTIEELLRVTQEDIL